MNLVRGENHKTADKIVPNVLKLLSKVAIGAVATEDNEVCARAVQGIEELSTDMFDNFKPAVGECVKVCVQVLESPISRNYDDMEVASFSLLSSLMQQYKQQVRVSGAIPKLIQVCIRRLVTDEDFGDEDVNDSSIPAAIAVLRQMVMVFASKYVFKIGRASCRERV